MGIDSVILVKPNKQDFDKSQLIGWSRELFSAMNGVSFRTIVKRSRQHIVREEKHSDDYLPFKIAENCRWAQIHTIERYYSDGCGRGDWPTIRAILFWSGQNIGQTWYGADTGGDFSLAADDWLLRQDKFWASIGNDNDTPWQKDSPICPLCNWHMDCSGGGPEKSFWTCRGCFRKGITNSKNIFRKVDEFF